MLWKFVFVFASLGKVPCDWFSLCRFAIFCGHCWFRSNRNFLEDRCTLNKVLRIIGKRWVAEVLVLIRNDVSRFSQQKQCLAGISDNVLSTVLNELVKEGLIEKQVFGEIPVRAEYKVTGKGKELTDLMTMLCKWGKTHIPFEVRMEPLRRAAAPL